MPPVGLLAIIALGLVVAYVLPQRIKERSEYGLVRVDDRYSSDMRVVKSTAERMERAYARASSDSGEVPLLRTGGERAAKVSGRAATSSRPVSMSRPSSPLDRAAVHAQREQLAMRSDRAKVLAERVQRARRRGFVALGALVFMTVAWVLVAVTTLSAVVAAIATAVFVGVVTAGARTAAAERRADAQVLAIHREVEAAATATQALRVVAQARAAGQDAAPSKVATQAIRILTAEDLAPLAAPAPVPAPELPAQAPSEQARPWTPQEVPAPAYTLKSTVKQREARPISDEDYDASQERAARWGSLRADDAPAASTSGVTAADLADTPDAVAEGADKSASEPETTTGALDAILARRRRASA